MKRLLSLMLCVLLLPLWAAADAPDMTFTLAVGQTLETGVFADQGEHKFNAKGLLPVWLELEAVTHDGWRLAVLSGEAAAAGTWRFTVEVTEYAPGDKKGRLLRNIDVQVIVTPDENGAIFHMDKAYREDGQYMLTVTEPTPVYRLPGTGEIAIAAAGTRLIACNDHFAEPDVIWCAAYSREYGYCWLPGTAVALEDRPQALHFAPGGEMRLPLFLVDDPDQARVEIRRDPKDAEVAMLQKVETQHQDSGEYLLTLIFRFSRDIPFHGRDRIHVTLYDDAGYPVEVVPLPFEAMQ